MLLHKIDVHQWFLQSILNESLTQYSIYECYTLSHFLCIILEFALFIALYWPYAMQCAASVANITFDSQIVYGISDQMMMIVNNKKKFVAPAEEILP